MAVQQELELRLKGHQQSTQLLGKIARDPPKTLLICTKHAHTFSKKQKNRRKLLLECDDFHHYQRIERQTAGKLFLSAFRFSVPPPWGQIIELASNNNLF